MSALAPTLQTFFTDRLVRQRQASPHTVAAYRDTLRLLVRFSAEEPKALRVLRGIGMSEPLATREIEQARQLVQKRQKNPDELAAAPPVTA